MAKRIGVVLAGSGHLDGSEIHEATLTLFFLSRAGAETICMAPDKPQMHVVDHLKREPATGEGRNVLRESARIARGKIKDIATVRAKDLDAIIVPGGYGAAKNLCTFAVDGPNCKVDEQVTRLLNEMHAAGKPIGALCIAPVILAKLFGADSHVTITIGNDAGTTAAVEKLGAVHAQREVTDIAVDEANRIVTTPCYMFDATIAQIGAGIEKLVQKIVAMT